MDNKKMLIFGLIAAAGIGLYIWSMKKKPSSSDKPDVIEQDVVTDAKETLKPEPATTSASYDETLITSWIGKMKANTEWYESIVKKAVEGGRSVKEQLRMDAIYMIGKS